eukprot:1746780-Amphidinium_carterae.1
MQPHTIRPICLTQTWQMSFVKVCLLVQTQDKTHKCRASEPHYSNLRQQELRHNGAQSGAQNFRPGKGEVVS